MFKKYPSIENSYRQKFIDRFLNVNPQLRDERFIITEKRDGSNIQLIFEPGKDLQIGSRNRLLSSDENFMGLQDVLPKYDEMISFFWKLADDLGVPISVYCELFGQGIQKRINYGEDKYIEVFDIFIHKEDFPHFMPQVSMYEDNDIHDYMVPVVDFVTGLQNALDHEPENFDKMEGVVIKPYSNVYYNNNGQIFYLKKKSPNFKEDGGKQKKPKEKPQFREEVELAKSEFQKYINENRLMSVFSKEGEIDDEKQIGKYIKLVLEDAKEDFYKDGNTTDGFDKKEVKYVFNVGSDIANMLKTYL